MLKSPSRRVDGDMEQREVSNSDSSDKKVVEALGGRYHVILLYDTIIMFIKPFFPMFYLCFIHCSKIEQLSQSPISLEK